MNITVSSLLCMEKSLRERLNQLTELAGKVSKKQIWMETNKVEEPQYDVKKVDTMIVKINRALFDINQKIKESNAVTKVDILIDFDSLTRELE